MTRQTLLAAAVAALISTTAIADKAEQFCAQHKAYAESVMASRQAGLNKPVLKQSVLRALSPEKQSPGMVLLLVKTVERAYSVPFHKSEADKKQATQSFASEQYSRCQAAMAAASQGIP